MRGTVQSVDPDQFFENLLNSKQLLEKLTQWLGYEVTQSTLDDWRRKGMPSIKIRRRRYFNRNEVAKWLQRSS